MHYYQHHIGDFVKDTANLNDHQLATYLRMIWSYYSEEKPFADAPEDHAFAFRSDAATIGLILRHYFTLGPDGWRHNRCDREIQVYHGKKEKASASAKARWNNAPAMRTHTKTHANASKSDANQEPITNNQDKDQKTIVADAPAPKKKTSLGIPFLVEQGVDQQVAADWLKVRKAPLTQTAWASVVKESGKAGITVATAVQVSAENSWRGFRADWYNNSRVTTYATHQQATQRIDNSAVGRVKQRIAERQAAEAATAPVRQASGQDDRDIRAPLDVEFRRLD